MIDQREDTVLDLVHTAMTSTTETAEEIATMRIEEEKREETIEEVVNSNTSIGEVHPLNLTHQKGDLWKSYDNMVWLV